MKILIRILLPAILLLTIASPLKATDHVKIQLKWYHQFQFAGYYAAVDKGFYADEGLDVEILEGGDGVLPIEEVIAGRATYGVAGPEILMRRLRGVPVKVLAVIFQHSPRVIISRKESNILTPQDLVGRKFRHGATSENLVEIHATLIKEGVSLENVNCVNDPWSMEDFINGKWDAFTGHISVHPYYLKEHGIEFNIIKPVSYGIDFYGDTLFTSDLESKRHPERVNRFRSASLKGWRYAMDHPDEIIQLIQTKYPGTGSQKTMADLKAEAESTRPLILPDLVEIGHMNRGRWEQIANIYRELGFVNKNASMEGFIYNVDSRPDIKRLYLIIGIATLISLLIFFISLVLYRLNRRLKKEIEGREVIEQELRKRSQALEQSDSTIVITDINGTIEYVNPAFERITGYTREEAIGNNPRVLKSGKHADTFYRDMWTTLTEGETWRGEMINKKSTGEFYWELVTISPIRDSKGKISHYVAIKEDISDRKRMEQDLIDAKQEADEANRAKSAFLANMSHELRTPLNGIIGFSQVLERQVAKVLSEKQLGYFKIIVESGYHLLEMVNDILDLSKIEAGKIELNIAPFDLETLLNRSPNIVKNIADDKKISVITNVREGLGLMVGDEVRLKQVVYNLLSNAIKFTDSGKRIGLDATYDKDLVTVTVWDEGIGIPREYIDTIFDAFVQVDSAQPTTIKGTGLGLSISKKLVELHQGSISVTSEEGKGSRFTITIPGRVTHDATKPADSNNKSIQEMVGVARHASILVVEDNLANRELFKAILDETRLVVSTSGEDALEEAMANDFDIILMDINLPKMDGTETMKRIRQGRNQKTPIFAVTSFAMKGDAEKYLAEGFDDYISKPLNVNVILEKIGKTLATKKK